MFEQLKSIDSFSQYFGSTARSYCLDCDEKIDWYDSTYWIPVSSSLSVSDEGRAWGSDLLLKQNGSIETTSYADLLRLSNLYVVSDSGTVRAYLAKYPFLVALLIDASFAIGKRFPGVKTELHVVTDPEISNSSQLCALIQATGSYNQNKSNLKSFERGWWFNAMERARGRLSIDLI